MQRLCPWCEEMYDAQTDQTGSLCSGCQSELMEQPKEFLVDLLAHITAVNLLMMAEAGDKDELLEKAGMIDTPKREGFTRRPLTMKQFARKHQRVQ